MPRLSIVTKFNVLLWGSMNVCQSEFCRSVLDSNQGQTQPIANREEDHWQISSKRIFVEHLPIEIKKGFLGQWSKERLCSPTLDRHQLTQLFLQTSTLQKIFDAFCTIERRFKNENEFINGEKGLLTLLTIWIIAAGNRWCYCCFTETNLDVAVRLRVSAHLIGQLAENRLRLRVENKQRFLSLCVVWRWD